MIDAHIINSFGVYSHTEQLEPMAPQPAGAIYIEPPLNKRVTRVFGAVHGFRFLMKMPLPNLCLSPAPINYVQHSLMNTSVV